MRNRIPLMIVLATALAACGGTQDLAAPAEEPDSSVRPAPAGTVAPPVPASSATPNAAPPPVIDRLPVDLATAVDLGQARYADDHVRSQGSLVAFGSTYADRPGTEPSVLLQFLDRTAEVVAGLDAVVIDVRGQPETCDAEILLVPAGSDGDQVGWVVAYDHVRNPTVQRGQRVSAGTVLGTPGSMRNGCDGPGRVELQVNDQANDVAVCPLTLMSDEARQRAREALRGLMTAWNTEVAPLYDPAELESAGCVAGTAQP